MARKAVEKYCTNCGDLNEGKYRGSFVITLFLLLCFLLPGLLYDHWRQRGGACVCKNCGKENLIPAESPMALKLRA
jgi:hypothetical protein